MHKVESRNFSGIRFSAATYVAHLLTQNLPAGLLFHNLNHTINVVYGVHDICRQMELSVDQKEVILLAAWFHDTGHIKTYSGHEKESQKLAKAFLIQQHYPLEKIEQVLDIIAATTMPQIPKDALQQVICDADLYHLTLWEYPFLQQQLKEERNQIFDEHHSDFSWQQQNLSFLENHHYFTTYGQSVLQKRKAFNIERCRQLIS